MYADHPLAGVGPGNFGHFYPHYKPAAALESVADPHNFPLSILTQYGPLGLVGFLAMIFVPLWRIISPKPIAGPAKGNQRELTFRTLVTILLIAVSTVLLLLRPVLMGGVPAEAFDVVTYVIVTMYVAPVAVFIISLMLLAGPLYKEPYTKCDIRNTRTAAFLCCAVLAVVLHNLIDFAIFEPGVFTALWALIACLVAIDSHANARVPVVLKPARPTSILIVTATLVAGWAYLSCVLVPVAKSTIRIQQANQAISTGQFEYAHEFLEKAAADDPLSNVALSHNGSFYLHHFRVTQDEDRDLLLRSVECLQAAIERNDAAYKNFERLTDVYGLLVEVSPHREKAGWLEKALDAGLLAVERYPGCGRLHFKLAQIADQSDKTDVALDHYKKAKEIEDRYRNQFRQMYPERKEVVSRLGDEKYRNAVQRIKLLKEQPLP
jgi:hypothetical protein